MPDVPPTPTPTPTHRIITPYLTQLLSSRAHPKTICPSEVARALSPADLAELGYESWRDAMPGVRRVAGEMRERGEVEVLQRGAVLEGDLGEGGMEGVVGPLRLRLVRR